MTASLHRVAPPRVGPPATEPVVHRRDIQGLRAVAVLLVVLGHAGVPGFGGGYVGVDVFFVISGYLITGLLLREHRRTGRISLHRFWARRATRLLPAATLVAVVTLAAAWLWLPPARMTGYGHDALASAGYVINMRLAAVATDYFAAQAASPFQHFWSLAVEEQFYLLWPLLLLVVVARRGGRWVAVALAVASLAFSVHELTRSAPWAYFGLPGRAWELLVGALLALFAVRVPRAVGWCGLAAVATAAVLYDDTTRFPGIAALLPVLGAAAVIASATPVTVLGTAPMQWLGRLSYSWYLWHWPLLIVVPVAAGTTGRLALCAVALLLALATYHGVEDPVRRALANRPVPGLALGAALSATTAAAAAAVIAWPPVVPAGPVSASTRDRLLAAADPQAELTRQIAAADGVRRIPGNLRPALAGAAGDKVRPQTDGCHLTLNSAVRRPACVYGPTAATGTIVLFGDSHALQWFPAVERYAERHGRRLVSLTRSSCSPAPITTVNLRLNRPYRECEPWRKWALDRIGELRPELVVVASISNYPGSLAGKPADPDQVWIDAWDRLLARLGNDAQRVAVVGDTPMLSGDPLDCLSTHATAVHACLEPADRVLRDPAWRAAVTGAARRARATMVDPTPWLCARNCPLIVGDLLVYRDHDHLTSAYSEALAPLLERALPRLP